MGGGQEQTGAPLPGQLPPQEGGTTIYQGPAGQEPIAETDDDYFEKLMHDLYLRMKAREEETDFTGMPRDAGGFNSYGF